MALAGDVPCPKIARFYHLGRNGDVSRPAIVIVDGEHDLSILIPAATSLAHRHRGKRGPLAQAE